MKDDLEKEIESIIVPSCAEKGFPTQHEDFTLGKEFMVYHTSECIRQKNIGGTFVTIHGFKEYLQKQGYNATKKNVIYTISGLGDMGIVCPQWELEQTGDKKAWALHYYPSMLIRAFGSMYLENHPEIGVVQE